MQLVLLTTYSVSLGLLSHHTSFMSKYGNANRHAAIYIHASMVLLLAHYQVLCYCSLAKPDPRTKSKTLISHDRYGIVFMHGQR